MGSLAMTPSTDVPALSVAFATIAHHSKSFALASRVLPPSCRAAAAVVYTWCRRADDAVDEAPDQRAALAALARERETLEVIYSEQVPTDPVMAAFQAVVRRHDIPKIYPLDLLAGMEMDVVGHRYESMDDLFLYAYRVAGTVGLMMSHVMGVSDARALRHAAHLGIAMQLTNICRDVEEDWQRGRLYLPEELLDSVALPGLRGQMGRPLSSEVVPGLARALARLIELSKGYYRSGDLGLSALPWRCALAVRTARLVYSAIGDELAARQYDVLSGRAVVPGARKLSLLAVSLWQAVVQWPRRLLRPFKRVALPVRVESHELLRL